MYFLPLSCIKLSTTMTFTPNLLLDENNDFRVSNFGDYLVPFQIRYALYFMMWVAIMDCNDKRERNKNGKKIIF